MGDCAVFASGSFQQGVLWVQMFSQIIRVQYGHGLCLFVLCVQEVRTFLWPQFSWAEAVFSCQCSGLLTLPLLDSLRRSGAAYRKQCMIRMPMHTGRVMNS